jgi:hydroxyacylglutathione hydrolase
MLFERIESPGLAHYSYVVGDGGDAAVIDPRRDVEAYVELLSEQGLRLRYVLETHRNEDYLVGSRELAAMTGAEIWHADAELDYRYGLPAEDGQRWPLGALELEAMLTPGHTPGHLCYVLRAEGEPWMVFSGDNLFAGDVGRTDLMGEDLLVRQTEQLYESLHGRILPLGPHVLLNPAHGPGSACGGSIADRPFTTLGLEQTLDPLLSLDREEFVREHAKALDRPPYFRRIEPRNLAPDGVAAVRRPTPLAPAAFAGECVRGLVLDTRLPPAYLAAHIPGSLSIWEAGLGSWAGWFLPADRPVFLVTDDGGLEPALLTLRRMGFDNVEAWLQGGMHAWHSEGHESGGLKAVSVPEARVLLDADRDARILDVRKPAEYAEGVVPGALLVPLAELGRRLDEVPRDGTIYIFCGTGLRSTIAASLLTREGWGDRIAVILGGMKGWKADLGHIK